MMLPYLHDLVLRSGLTIAAFRLQVCILSDSTVGTYLTTIKVSEGFEKARCDVRNLRSDRAKEIDDEDLERVVLRSKSRLI